MVRGLLGMCAIVLGLGFDVPVAQACGGFFCGRQPVDQTAERIIFAVDEDSTRMTVQISYTGAAEDFSWILPLGTVPDPQSIEQFPQRALNVLDANTSPVFVMPDDPDCFTAVLEATADGGGGSSDPDVTVNFREQVGPFDIASVESDDYMALVSWLRDNGYRVTEPMEPYMAVYTEEGMNFLAVKLVNDANVDDITPLGFDLPGGNPSIPLRMTSIAAEPEMGIVVHILGDTRFGPANWPEVTVDDADIVWSNENFGPLKTNYLALVAKGVDEAGGRGWVTELAQPTAPFVEQIQSQSFVQPEDVEARDALLELLQAYPYITRLYTRMSAEEMTLDALFEVTGGTDVDNVHQLHRFVGDVDLCPGDVPTSSDPCDFVTCGAGGLCVEVVDDAGQPAAACACVPGATARTTFDPAGELTVICQDRRMSFINPGDQGTDEVEALGDPCLDYDCGAGGVCVAVNMTPTCVCDQGKAAVGSMTADGRRQTKCITPSREVPVTFYEKRLPDLPSALPGGVEVDVPARGGSCSVAGGGPAPLAWLLAPLGWLASRRRRR